MGGLGFNREQELEKISQIIKEHSEQTRRLHANKLWKERVPERWVKALKEDFPPALSKDISDIVNNYRLNRNTHNSRILVGPSGSGKTYWGYALCHELILTGLIGFNEFKIISETDLSSISISGFERGRQMRELLNPDLKILIIEDVGTAPNFGHGADNVKAMHGCWLEVINYCYSKGVILVATSSLSQSHFKERVGGLAYSKLASMTGKVLDFSKK